MTAETRVLHLITRFLKGGAEKTTKNTLRSLQNAATAYDLRLGFGVEYDSDEVVSVQNEGIDTVCFRSIRHYNPVTQPIAVFAVARYLRREDIDILHTHSTEAGIIGRLAGWLAGTPIVIHEVHGDPITEDRNPVLNATIERLERVTARLSTRIIVKSETIRKTYLERRVGRPGQYELIYHGVDLERFRDVEPAAIDAPDSEVVLLFVGRLEDGKGLFDLLSTFEDLELVGGQSARLLIVGDGSQRPKLEREIRTRNITNVDVLGYREDVPQLMAAADVFVLPSYREGTPRVITEGLASGLPVVSTSIAGIPEQVADGETGFLIRPGDTAALKDRLQELCSDPQLRDQMSQQARTTVDKFSLTTAQTSYQKLYLKLLNEVE